VDEDIKLMLGLKAGDREAFNRIVEKHSKSIINFIYRFTASREDAEDLAQDVFIRVYNAAQSYSPSAKFTTWIYRIASNISIDFIRKRKGEKNNSSLDEKFETDEGSPGNQTADINAPQPDKEAEQNETNEEINGVLQSLPENQRAAIIMKIYEDRPYAEIAQVLGVSISSVESLIFRARSSLKTRLKNNY